MTPAPAPDGPGALRSRRLCVVGRGEGTPRLVEALSARGAQVEHRPAPGPELAALGCDLVLVDYDALAGAGREALWRALCPPRSAPLVIVSALRTEALAPLFRDHRLTHLLAWEGDGLPERLIATVEKLVGGEVFGLARYLPQHGLQRFTLKGSREKAEVLAAMRDQVKRSKVNPRLGAGLMLVAEELLTNALYNAPTDAAGAARFRALGREVEVSLAGDEVIEVQLCAGADCLGVSTADPFGSLSEARVLELLASSLGKRDRPVRPAGGVAGGAGLGMGFIFDSLSHLVVNLEPERRTEMIGLIDTRGTYRDFAARPKSFDLFVTG
ncbi:MAG: hypothetical protein IPJ65_26025 [Archangiaceae bacterium]|nr:hypothetical protein [Archangiaceae bacterium]